MKIILVLAALLLLPFAVHADNIPIQIGPGIIIFSGGDLTVTSGAPTTPTTQPSTIMLESGGSGSDTITFATSQSAQETPEPSSLVLLITGLGILLAIRGRKKNPLPHIP